MSANGMRTEATQRGFTLIELVTIMILLGILAVVALPHFNLTDFAAARFRDEALSGLRYAQKAASSHRRLVCASLAERRIDFAIAATSSTTTCTGTTPLPLPANGQAQVSTSDSAVSLSATSGTLPATLFFRPDGTIDEGGAWINRTLSINGLTITLTGETGLVQ